MLNVTPQLPPKKNIAYFGAETKTKKCGRKWRRLLGASGLAHAGREREKAKSKRDKRQEAEKVSVKVGRLGAQSRR